LKAAVGAAAAKNFVGGVVVGTAVLGYLDELIVDAPWGVQAAQGVVTVARRTPACTCGWTGRRRIAVFLARHDGWMHAAGTGCQPGVPFVTQR
jgi:hypothetical protein